MSSEATGTSGFAGRYASALYDLAVADGAVDEVADDLSRLQDMLDGAEDLRRMIHSPVISREAQGRAMDAVLERAGVSGLTRRFVGVVAANRRLFALPDMIAAWRALLARHRGEVTAEVTSAIALSAPQRDAIADALSRVVGGKVAVRLRVDAGIIGGLVVRIGSRMVDSSLRTKLERLQLAMKGAA